MICAISSTMPGVWLAEMIKFSTYTYIIPRIIFQKNQSKLGLLLASTFIIFAYMDYIHGIGKNINIGWLSFIKAAVFSVFSAKVLINYKKNKLINFNYLLFIIIILVIVQYITDVRLGYTNYREGWRLTPLTADPNFLSIWLYNFAVLSIVVNKYMISIISIYVLLGSKTIITLIIATWVSLNKKKGVVVTFLVIIGVLIITISYPEETGLGRTITEVIDGNYVFQRSYMWNNFGALAKENIMLGYGHGYSKYILGTYMHNDYLEVLISFGLVGLSLLFIQKLIILSYIKKRRLLAILPIFIMPIMFSINANEFYIYLLISLVRNESFS